MLSRWTSLLVSAASCFAFGCSGTILIESGDDTTTGSTPTTSTDTDTGTGTTSTTTTSPQPPGISNLHAPDQTSVRIVVTPAVNGAPSSPSAYVITSDHGPLVVETVSWDPQAKVIRLGTAKQKLGVTYALTISAPGDVLDGLGGTMLAADTAVFWATDFETFEPYEVKAERVGVGERTVLYLDPALFADDIDQTIAEFDTAIYPIETSIFRSESDRDDNGRTVLLGLDGQEYYGGYFSPVNAISDDLAQEYGYRSNEMELLYLNVAAMGGYRPEVVAHEFLHLLYQEEHSFLEEVDYFAYHNEGLAECAVHAVYGHNESAGQYYVFDPNGDLATGKSLVHWEDGNYSQYAQAYVFWTYVASQLGGVSTYGDLFHSKGSPASIHNLLLNSLGLGFPDTHLRALAAAWAQAPTGPYGFQGMLSLPGPPPAVPFGTPSLSLSPFAAAFFLQDANGVTPTGAGPHISFIGLDSMSQPDVAAPFDVAGGVVIALHARTDDKSKVPESSGVLGGGGAGAKITKKPWPGRDPAWFHPPPLPPTHGALEAWRKRTSGF